MPNKAPESLPHLVDVASLIPYDRNARTHSGEQIEQIKASIRQFGFVGVLAYDESGLAIGHGRQIALLQMWEDGETVMGPGKRTELPRGMAPAVNIAGLSDADRRALIIADNKLALNAGWDDDILAAELAALSALDFDMPVIGFDAKELERLISQEQGGEQGSKSKAGSMAAEFLIPPFTVLNAREGWWQSRKRQWIELGIQSEVGRGENLLKMSDTMLEPDPEKRAAMIAERERAAQPGGGGTTYGLHGGGGFAAQMAGGRKGQNRDENGESVYLKGSANLEITTDPYRKGKKGGKALAANMGQELIGRRDPETGLQAKSIGSAGTLSAPLTYRDPHFYAKKRKWEAENGRSIDTTEFREKHWDGGQPSGADTRATHTQDWVQRKIEAGEIEGGMAAGQTGTSIFDPVLCELAYRWFSPVGGLVLDPFAGGSVRGIVCAALGRQYVGIDLRPEQIEANKAQWPAVAAKLGDQQSGAALPPIRVDEIEGLRVVRDDILTGGTKRRALERIIPKLDYDEFVYATPAYGFAQMALAYACRSNGRKATVFVAGRKQPHLRTAMAAEAGAQIIEIEKGGYLTTVQKRAKDYAEENGAFLVPFGMDDELFVETIAQIASEIPGPTPTEVWCVAGSGVLTRALQRAWPDAQHHAVQIGSDPKVGNAKLWVAPEKFEDDAKAPPPFPSCTNYDAKAWQFIKENASPGALFWNLGADPEPVVAGPEPQWITGDSLKTIPTLDVQADMIFSCPPYGDLEVYSDDPDDISTKSVEEFDRLYAQIIGEAVAKLKDDRFACFVVGDYRDKRGIYANFVSKTIAAFEQAGAPLYNEAILVTCVGSLPIRAAKQFRTTRKLGKTHQNILVFVKGDPRKATEALGPVDVSAALAEVQIDEE